MEQNTKAQRQKLRQAYIELGLGMRPNAFVTLTTNDATKSEPCKQKEPEKGPSNALTWRYKSEPKISEMSKTLDMTRLIGEYLAMMDRALLGRKWSQLSPDQRTDGIFIIEHTKTNIHAHGLLHFPKPKTHDLELLTLLKWSTLTQAGSTNFQSIYDAEHCAEYCTKEMNSFLFNADQVVLARQFMAS
ncbi:hypothetical protein ACA106_16650 [Agrobacterium pusense]|uniref:hypothetical protein n=1 Tax=Agrobacterium pusense TaxID=648995 RepID=UPI0035A5A109